MQHLPSTMRDVGNGTLAELLTKLDTDELRRGKQFERIVKWWLQNDAARTRNIKTVWLWDEWPDRPGRDIGVDLVTEMLDGSLCAIQAKCFNSDRDIPKSEIDSFISAASPRTFAQRWLVATTNGLSANARRTIQDNHVTFIPLAELETAAVTWPTNPNALKASKKLGRAKPRPHQQRAIREVLNGLKTNSRGQMIMACGTGKTLTALWITERLDSNTTLVLVPSLNLLSQTLTEWAHNTSTQWSYICVCSDDTVNKEDDQPINTTVDLPYPVTTKPSEIADFLKRRGPKIVFSTYQSSAQVAKAQKLSRKKFELVICDEAHRLTGKTEADYATVLDEKKIISKKRLFMTATPRTYTANVKAKAEERGVEITSMDDPNVYGPQFHRLTFGEAIKQELLTDYQVVIVGVTDPQVQELIDRRELVSVNNTVTTDARTLAAHIGLAKATKDFNLARTISFHSRIKTAAQFASDHPNILEWLPNTHKPEGTTWTDTISGDMNTGQRRTLLQQLRKNQPGRHALLTNARCLTEGVDVPTLDGVAFIDPRSSQVDIIQAVGRAIRRSASKSIGTIVLPVLIPDQADPDEILSDSAFKSIWAILNALKSHDGQLSSALDSIRKAYGRTGSYRDLPGKIHIDLPASFEGLGVRFFEALKVSIIRNTTESWISFYGALVEFQANFGHLRVPLDRQHDGVPLQTWILTQRNAYRKRLLSAERQDLLEAIPGWTWHPQVDGWTEMLMALADFAERHGHHAIPSTMRVGGRQVAVWIENQRTLYKRGDLSTERVRALENVPGWFWDAKEASWESNFKQLKEAASRGHDAADNYRLHGLSRDVSHWVVNQRILYRRNKLTSERTAMLESIPHWSWEPDEDSWLKTFAEIKKLATNSSRGKLDSELRRWISRQRTAYVQGTLQPRRVSLLETLPGWQWEPHEDQWRSSFQVLLDYVSRVGHAKVPDNFRVGDFNLGSWVGRQRAKHKIGRLAEDKALQLEALAGWSWQVRRGPSRTKSVPRRRRGQ